MHNKFLFLAIIITSISVFSCTGDNVDNFLPADGLEIIDDATIAKQKLSNLNLAGSKLLVTEDVTTPVKGVSFVFEDGENFLIRYEERVPAYLTTDESDFFVASFDGRKRFNSILKDNKGNYLSLSDGESQLVGDYLVDDDGYLRIAFSDNSGVKYWNRTGYKYNPIILGVVNDHYNYVYKVELLDTTIIFQRPSRAILDLSNKKQYSLNVFKDRGSCGFSLNNGENLLPLLANKENCKVEIRTKQGTFDISEWKLEPQLSDGNSKNAQNYNLVVDFTNTSQAGEAELFYFFTDNSKNVDLKLADLVINNQSSNISGFRIEKRYNKDAVLGNVEAVINDSIISISSPFIMDATHLIPVFDTDAIKVEINGRVIKSGETAIDFSKDQKCVLYSEDGTSRTYLIQVKRSLLPVLFIDTDNHAEVKNKTDWMKATIRLYGEGGNLDYEGEMEIKGRGNATWTYPKKPYNIKLSKKASLLGMPKDKRWCLLANFVDKTLLRNEFAFQVARSTDMEWTPRGEYVELVFNGSHVGNYYLCEKIKIGENRLNIDNSDGVVDRGYLMEIDNMYDEEYKFTSERGLPYMFKDPDVVSKEQFNYVQSFVSDMEQAIYSSSDNDYLKYIDADSWIDSWIVFELTQNYEPLGPRSCFVYMDKGGLMKSGPVWDFDCGTFSKSTLGRYRIKDALYYGELFKKESFRKSVKDHWNTHKKEFEKIPDRIRSLAKRLSASQNMNESMWPVGDAVNDDVFMSYQESVNSMIEAYMQKKEWLDKMISEM